MQNTRELILEEINMKYTIRTEIDFSDKITVQQTEDKFFILKDQKKVLELDKKHLPDLVDALIELQNI
jgi:hypothetical protein